MLLTEEKNEKERSEYEGKLKKLTINDNQLSTEIKKSKQEFFIKKIAWET